jgi:hypothetical protein
MTDSVTPHELLVVTLRYLVTGRARAHNAIYTLHLIDFTIFKLFTEIFHIQFFPKPASIGSPL